MYVKLPNQNVPWWSWSVHLRTHCFHVLEFKTAVTLCYSLHFAQTLFPQREAPVHIGELPLSGLSHLEHMNT